MPGALFDADGSGIYYTTCDEAWRPDTVLAARRSAPPAEDEQCLHGAGRAVLGRRRHDPQPPLPRDRGRLEDHERVLAARHAAPGGRLPGRVAARRGRRVRRRARRRRRPRTGCSILHNDGAENFELVAVDRRRPAGSAREVLLPAPPGVRLEEMDAFARLHRRVVPRKAARPRRPARRDAERETDRRDRSSTSRCSPPASAANPEWAQPTLRLGFGSMITPSTVFDLDTRRAAPGRLLKQQPVLGGYDPPRTGQRREWATAEDGTRVPISLVGRADLMEDRGQPAPVLLYGYGSYEASIDPSFSHRAPVAARPRRACSRSRMCAAAARWAATGTSRARPCTKRNTFTDFVAAARHLVAEGWTEPPSGSSPRARSAGGLLMGAVANLAPELFAGIHAGRAVRRPADLDPRPVAAADGHRVGRVGRPAARPGGVRLHEVVLAARERGRPPVSADPRDDER